MSCTCPQRRAKQIQRTRISTHVGAIRSPGINTCGGRMRFALKEEANRNVRVVDVSQKRGQRGRYEGAFDPHVFSSVFVGDSMWIRCIIIRNRWNRPYICVYESEIRPARVDVCSRDKK
eukprot:1177390-Prorocentrum_minimum.AAC.7